MVNEESASLILSDFTYDIENMTNWPIEKVSRPLRERIVRMTIQNMDQSSEFVNRLVSRGDDRAARREYSRLISGRVITQYEQEYGFISSILMSMLIKIIINLIIKWWLSRQENRTRVRLMRIAMGFEVDPI